MPVTSDAQLLSAQQRLLHTAHSPLRSRRRKLRNPHTAGSQFFALTGEHLRGRPVGYDSPAGGENDHTVDNIAPHGNAMLDNHNRCTSGFSDTDDGIPNVGDALRVEVCGWLVKHNEARPHREYSRER
jgi:hypothetical protein